MGVTSARRALAPSSLLRALMRRIDADTPAKGGGRRRSPRHSVALEALEPRLLLSGDLNVNLTNLSDVTLTSREVDNVVFIDVVNNQTGVAVQHLQALDANSAPVFDNLIVTGTGLDERVRIDLASGLGSLLGTGIQVNTQGGDDLIEVSAGETTGPAATISLDGGAGRNTIYGLSPSAVTLGNTSMKLGTNGPTMSLANMSAAFLTGNTFSTAGWNAGPLATADVAQWTEQGPGPMSNGQLTGIPDKPVSGAIQAVLAHPSQADTLYIGAAAGGIWKTTDGGVHWTPLTDQFASQSISALAFDNADANKQTIYAGTGKFSSYGSFGKAIGLLKTTDGGVTWKLLNDPLFSNNSVFGIVANGSTVLAATERGLLRSLDAGAHWHTLAYVYADTVGVTAGSIGSGYKAEDIVKFQYGTGAADFISVRIVTVNGSGGVLTVELLDRGSISAGGTLPGAATAVANVVGTGTGLKLDFTTHDSQLPGGKMTELVADPAHNVIYVAAVGVTSPGKGVYRSLDGGATFLQMPGAGGPDFTQASRIRLSIGADSGGQSTLFVGVAENGRTTLAAAVAQGATTITLASTTAVEVGEKLVLLKPGTDEGETLTVSTVNRASGVVTLTTAVQTARAAGDAVRQEKGEIRVTQVSRLTDPRNADGSGTTWKNLDRPGDSFGGINPGGQADKHFSFVADRTSADIVFIGGDIPPKNANGGPGGDANPQGWTGRLLRGNAAGASGSQWSAITDDNADHTAPHGDSRNMVFRANGDLIEVDDGGIKRLADPNDTDPAVTRRWHSLDGDLRLTEFTSVAYDPNNNIIAGGAQDNGVSRQDAPGSFAWTQLIPADGMVTQFAVGSGGNSTLYSSPQNFKPFLGFKNLESSSTAPDLEVNHTGVFDDDELYLFDKTIQFRTLWTLNQVDPKLLMIGTTFLYEEDPDFLIGGDLGDDVTLQNGSPVKVSGTYTPPPGAAVGIVTSIAYGGHVRPDNSPLQDVPRVAYVSSWVETRGADGKPRATGKLFVRLGEDQKFVEITSWGGTVVDDIVMDPEDWRTLYVLDNAGDVWVGKQSAANTANYNWQKISGNLGATASVGALRGSFNTIEVYLDEGVNQFLDSDDKRVVMVGGFGGVFRTTNPVDNTAVWSELGGNLPSNLVTDLHYDATDDLLLAGTLGRGAWTLEHASRWLSKTATLTITGAPGNVNDTLQLGLDATRPWLMDLFAHTTGTPATSLPQAQLPVAGVDRIVIKGGGGDDTITLDGSHGLVAVANGISVDGEAGTNALNVGWERVVSRSAASPSEVKTTAKDGFGTERSVTVSFSNTPAPATASIDPADAAGGGMLALSDAMRHLLDGSLSGKDLPFFNAGSLSGTLSGRTIDSTTPPSLPYGTPVRAGVGGGPLQIDDGGSLLSRLLDSDSFSLGSLGDITSLALLRAELDALDDIDGNVTLDESDPANRTLRVRIVRQLEGVVDLDLDGAALLGALNVADGRVDIEGIASIGFQAALDLTVGVDASGFYVAPSAPGAQVLAVDHITLQPQQLSAAGHFGWLGVELANPTVTFAQDAGFRFALNENVGSADGRIRLEELAAAPAGMMAMQLVTSAGGNDLVVHATLDVGAVIPGVDITLPVADADATFTWADLGDTPTIVFDNPAAQGALDFSRFLSLDPSVLITQLDGLKTSIKDMVGKIDLDLPFLSVSLGGVADLLDVVDDNLLSRIGYRLGGVGSLLPDFGSIQDFTTGLYSSLLLHADPANYGGSLNGLFDLANLPQELSYNSGNGELTYALDFRRGFDFSDTLDLDFDLGGGLGEFSTSSSVHLTGQVKLAFKLGIDLQDALDGGNPLDWIFLRDADLNFSITADATDIDALARFGFVKIEVVDGHANANFAVDLKLTDPGTGNKADGRIDINEIKGAILGDIDTLVDLSTSGSASVTLPVKVPFLNLNDPQANDPIVVSIPDFSNLDSLSVNLGSLANVGLDGFANIDASTIVGMLAQFTGYLEQFRQSDDFKAVDIPLIGEGLDNVLTLADAVRDKLLFDDGDDGLDGPLTLLYDINAALKAAGLDTKIHAENANGHVSLVANDDAITSIALSGGAGLGFNGSETSGGPVVRLVATGVAPANGQLAADVLLSVVVNNAAAVAVSVKKTDTVDADPKKSNKSVGNDVWKLVGPDNAPTFTTVEELTKRMVDMLGPNLFQFNGNDDTLNLHLALSELLGRLDVPLNFLPKDLPAFLTLKTQGMVRLDATANLTLDLGIYIGNAGGTTLDPQGGTLLKDLADEVVISTDRHVDAANPIAFVMGRLSNDAHFSLSVDQASPVVVSVTKAATQDNTTAADLAADFNAAFAALPALAGKVQAVAVGDKLSLRTVGSHSSLVLVTTSGDPLVKDVGFLQQQVGIDVAGVFTIDAGKDLAKLYGRLPANASQAVITLTLGNGSPVQVPVTAAATVNNRFAFDLVTDIQDAITAAGLTWDDPSDGKAVQVPRVKVSVVGGKLGFTSVDGSTSLQVAADAAAQAAFGLAANASGNSDDLLITTRDNTSHRIALDGALTLAEVFQKIAGGTGQRVTAEVNARHAGITLTDHSVPANGGVFSVQGVNGEIAGVLLGLVRPDAQQGEKADGVIEGANIAGLKPLERFFIGSNAPLGSVSLAISTPGGLSATAGIGFIDLTATGSGQAAATLSLALNDPDNSGRVTLQELLDGVDHITDLFALNLSGGGSFALNFLPDAGLAVLGLNLPNDADPNDGINQFAGFDVTLNLGNVFAPVPVPPTLQFAERNLASLAAFKNPELSFQSILAGLRRLVEFLEGFESFGFLDDPLPVVNVSVGELIDLAGKLGDAVDEAQKNPAGTIRFLEGKLKEAFGLAPNSNLIHLVLVHDNNETTGDTSDDFDILKVSLNFEAAFSKTLGVDFDLGLPFDLGGSANLSASGSVALQLDFGFGLQDPTDIFVFNTTGASGSLDLVGSDLSFHAGYGPLGVFIDGGSASLHGTLAGNKLFTAGLAGASGYVNGRKAIGDVLGDFGFNAGAAVNVSLPVFFPSDSILAGTVLFDAALGFTPADGITFSANPHAIDRNGAAVGLADLFAIDLSKLSLLDQLLLGVDGFDAFLGGLQDLLDGSIGGISLPLIGDKLSGGADAIGDFREGFVEGFRTAIEQMANPSASFAAAGFGAGAGPSLLAAERDPVSKILYQLLGPQSTLKLIDSWDDIVFNTNINQPGITAEEVFFDWDLVLGKQLLDVGAGIGFDLGIPGLGLETKGDVHLDIDWQLLLGFGLDMQHGFYFDTSKNAEMTLDVDVTIPGLEITGTLGFLQVRAKEDVDPTAPDPVTHLGATFAIDLTDGQAGDGKLGFAELGDLDIDAKVAADAVADLEMRLSLSSELVPSAPTRFPSLVADFIFDWGLGDRDNDVYVSLSELHGGFLSNGLKLVQFDHVGLDLGSYFSDLIGPIVDTVQEVTEPIKPFLDFLTEPIPIISQLAGPTSLLDIAALSGVVNPGIIKAIEVVDTVVDIANQLKGVNGSSILYFDQYLPELVIYKAPANGLAAAGAGGLNLDLNGPPDIDAIKGFIDTLPDEFAFLGDVVDGLNSVFGDSLKKMLPGGGAHEGFSLPIVEDPAQVFGMLLGQPAVLVQYDMAALEIEASFSAFFSLLGPLGVSINADFAGQFGPFTFGYDTLGIQEFASGDFKNPLTLFDGFFVGDLDAAGVDVPELQFDAGLWAAAELNLAVARGGVGGGLFADIDFDLHDPDDDGRVRLKEIAASVINEFKYGSVLASPLAMFDITGKLTAELFAFLKVDLFLLQIDEHWNITDPITLLDFASDFVRVPTLATELGDGVLQLNMGKYANQRVEGDLSDGDETFVVKQGDDASHVKVWSTLVDFDHDGYDDAEAQDYEATSLILALGGQGNDVIDASGVTANLKLEFEGNAGNDVLKAGSGSGAASLKGGAGDDELWGGGGDDNLFGEGGRDKVHGGGGADWIFGDGDAKKLIDGSVIKVEVRASDADDELWGDEGDDLMFGAGGSETTFLGGAGDDVMLGDGGTVTVSGRTVAGVDAGRVELKVEDHDKGRGARDVMDGGTGKDHLYGGAGNDELHGGDDADVAYGGSGRDTLWGDGGADILFGDLGAFAVINSALTPLAVVGGDADEMHGGAGDDKMLGGAGNDVMDGDEDNDWLWGGTGKDLVHGGLGDDHAYGNAEPDQLFGDEGNDYLEGGGGQDFVRGGIGGDLLVAGYGSDDLDGEEGSDNYRISARGGVTTELTIAYDSGGIGDTDQLRLVGTADPDTVLLRAMADFYFPSIEKLIGDNTDPKSKGLTDRIFGSKEPDKLAAMLQALDDAYGPHDMPAGLVDQLITLFTSDRKTGVKNAIAGAWLNETGAPSVDSLKALVDTILGSSSRNKLEELQKAIQEAYTAGSATPPGTMFDDIIQAWQPVGNGLQNAFEAKIDQLYLSEALVGLLKLVDTLFDPAATSDADDAANLATLLDAVNKAYGGSAPAAMVTALTAAMSQPDDQQLQALQDAIRTTYHRSDKVPGIETDTGFVALINNGGANVERFNYRQMEGLVIDTLGNDDLVVADDVIAITTINLGEGNDKVQIGQVFRSERVRDFGDQLVTGITAEDVFTTLEITRGWLSNGISRSTTVNGMGGNDEFTVFRNVAVLNLNGNDGDDTFTVRAFALKGSSDNERARTDMKGDAGADTILYVVNAPVGIDGGDGFDTVRVVGTEFGDDFVVTDTGVYGAGLNVNYVNIEKLVADGAEGNDRFFVLSTGIEVITEIDGGLGSDSFFVGGNPSNAPVSVVSNDLKGHSGVVLHSVESGDLDWNKLPVDGLSANVGDADDKAVMVYETEGGSRVVEGAAIGLGAGWGYDSFAVRLTRAPAPGIKVRVKVVSAGLSGEDLAKGFQDLLFYAPSDQAAVNAGELTLGTDLLTGQPIVPTLVFGDADWWKPQYVRFAAADDGAAEGRRFTFVNLTMQDSDDAEYREVQALAVKVFMEDNDRDGLIVTPSGRDNVVLEGANGFGDSFTVRPTKAPDNGATITVKLDVTTTDGVAFDAAGTLKTLTLSFNALDWQTAKTVQLFGAADTVVEGFHTDYIRFTVTSGDGDKAVPVLPNDAFVEVDGDFDLLGVQDIPPEKPTTNVFLPHRPIAGTLEIMLDGVLLQPAQYSLSGNTVTFLTTPLDPAEAPLPRYVTGDVKARYQWLDTGYDGLQVKDQVVDIYDDDTPMVIVIPTEGSTDVVEDDPTDGIDAGKTDQYTVRLSQAPDAGTTVKVRLDPTETRTSYGRTTFFEDQVTLSDDGSDGDGDTTLLTFSAANWNTPRTVTVHAIADQHIDGNDTQVFAPELQTVNKIRGPLLIEGAAGAGSLSLPDPLMLPWERNQLEPDGRVVDFEAGSGAGAVETMTVRQADLQAVIADLKLQDSTVDSLEDLIGKTLEMASGPGTDIVLDPNRPDDLFDRFWLIVDYEELTVDNVKLVKLKLQNPSTVDPDAAQVTAPLGVNDAPSEDEASQFAITSLSVNFFADERDQVDYLFVYDQDSVADDRGRLTSSDGLVRAFAGSQMTVDTNALQRAADLIGYADLQKFVTDQVQLTITVGPGQGAVYKITGMADGAAGSATKVLTLQQVKAAAVPGQLPTDRSEFRLAGSDAKGRVTGFGMGPNLRFDSGVQPGGITYGDIEVMEMHLGRGADHVDVDYTSNAEDHTTQRTGDFKTLTMLDTGAGNDEVRIDLSATEDGDFMVNGEAGDDTLDATGSTLGLVMFGWDGGDNLTGGEGDDILFGDVGRVDYLDANGEIITRLGHSVAPVAKNPKVDSSGNLTLFDADASFATDYGGLVGLMVQAISPQGHVQFRRVVANTADTLTIDRPWDQNPTAQYNYRISALPEDQTDGVFRGPRVAWSILENSGGDDSVHAGGGNDLVVGGKGDDRLWGGGGHDAMAGDNARFDFVPVEGGDGPTRFDRFTTLLPDLGGVDTLFGDAGEDLLAGGAQGDRMDGGADADLLFGDNVVLNWHPGSFDALGPRFVQLGGPAASTALYDAAGKPLLGARTNAGAPAVAWAHWTLDLNVAGANDGGDYIAGGAGNDEIFAQRGNDTVQGDGSIAGLVNGGPAVGASRPTLPSGGLGDLTVVASFEDAGDGDDYVEGNAGDDVIFGNLGQDDLVGGSSTLWGQADRQDGRDLVFGGAGTDLARNNLGDGLHGRDADAIVGDNGSIFRLVDANGAKLGYTFDDAYAATPNDVPLVVRAVRLDDYTPGRPNGTDKGAADELHGESGDDALYGMAGDDVLYGEGQDDDLVGGWGNDWLSGGAGQDGLLGDDGRILTSRNGKTETLAGVFSAVQPATVATGGNVQLAQINVADELKKSVNLEPFSVDGSFNASKDELRQPGNDDLLFGGLGSDWLHGGSGDDALSGAEASVLGWAPFVDPATQSPSTIRIDYARPNNPGNALQFNPIDADAKKNTTRAGEFALYNEYAPMQRIFLTDAGTWAATGKDYFLNFVTGDVNAPADAKDTAKKTDGDDRLFGDTGNDWLVGGTGRDDLYGGFGNDLLDADDDLTTAGGLNNQPDANGGSYEDRAFGGAGRDVLIGNTGGDRLIDWAGEYNTFLVPFSPFGTSTVSRMLQPALPEFLYALSRSDGADPTRAGDVAGADPARNGEPFGELGLVLQQDAAWHDQTGGPADPQPGNNGAKRDVLRSADFDNGSAQGFLPVVGTWTVSKGRYQVAPATASGDALSIFNQADTAIPTVFEMQATINAVKPLAGTRANAYLIFDYWGTSDFKFAGIDVSTNKLQIGHRTASGWVVDASVNVQIKPATDYVVLLSIDGNKATVKIGTATVSFGFKQRVDAKGIGHFLNEGIVGIGASGAAAQIDNVVVQKAPGPVTLERVVDFGATGPASSLFALPGQGSWTSTAGGRFESTAALGAEPSVALVSGLPLTPGSLLEMTTTMRTGGQGGVVFDYHGPGYFKFATLSVDGKQVLIGHRVGAQWVIDRAVAFNAAANTDVVLTVSVRAGLVNVSVNGAVLASTLFNEQGTDGRYGLLARNGLTSFDRFQLRSDDVRYATTQAVSLAVAPTASATDAALPTMKTASAQTTSQSASQDGMTLVPLAGLGMAVDAPASGGAWRVDAAAPQAKASPAMAAAAPVTIDWTLPSAATATVGSSASSTSNATAGTAWSEEDWRLRFVTQSAAPAHKPNVSLKLQLPVSALHAGDKVSRWAA